jgi:serine phosphatase RsbU (regulator of sigma subunit)
MERLLLAIALVATQYLLVHIARSGLLMEASRTLSTHTSRWVLVLSALLQVLVIVGLVRLVRERRALLTVSKEGIAFRDAGIAFSSVARLGFYQSATRKGLAGRYTVETHEGRVLRFEVHPRDHNNPQVAAALEAIERRTHRRWLGRAARRDTFRNFLGVIRRGASRPSGGGFWPWLGKNTFTIQSHAAELNDPVYRWTAPMFYVPLIVVLITIVYLLTPGVRLHYGVEKIMAGPASGLTPIPRLIIVLQVVGWIFTALGVNALVLLMRTQTRNREALEAQLNAAREVQMRLLPAAAPVVEGFEMTALCLPALEVGGDYYDFIRSRTGRAVVAVGDVSGKGLPAALLMTMVKGCLTTALQHQDELGGVASLLNRSILDASPDRTFVTMVLATPEPSGRVRLVRAGHPPPLLLRGSELQWLCPDGAALGMRLRASAERHWEIAEVVMGKGDLMVLYTDGITEELSETGEQYGTERLVRIVRNNRDQPLESLQQAIVADVRAFRARPEPSDDLTLVLVRKT